MSPDRAADFGTKLRDARERKGVSLRAIADATKISVAALEALERNDVSRLPGGIFSRAFVRSYALEVGLDPDTTIQEFVAQFPHESVTAGHETMPPSGHTPLDQDRQASRTFMRLVGIGLPVAAAIVYFGVGMQRAARTTEPPAAVSPAPVPPQKGEAPAPARDAAPSPPAPTLGDAPTTRPPDAPPAPPAEPTAAAKADAPASDALTIVLSARRRCYVSATVDGRKAIEQLMPENDHRTLDVRKEMVLTVGDAAAIVMTLNGAPARPIGKTGEVVTVRVNPANFKDYLQTR